MFKMLIVDDEEIEREGMAQFIPWDQYEIELAGTAWNGVDALEQIEEKRPDIILTDIKMPVMDGIELIRKTMENFPDVRFIVLSGYGEFEYTSKAMELGIRYYVLKPCDENQIMDVVGKVKEEIKRNKEKQAKEKLYHHTVRRILPRAREEIFRNMLLGREQISDDYELFLRELKGSNMRVQLLALRNVEKVFDSLEQFIMENVLTELLGEQEVLLTTTIQNCLLFLIAEMDGKQIRLAVERVRKEYRRIQSKPLYAAVSQAGNLCEVTELYTQIKELFHMEELDQSVDYLQYGQPGRIQTLEQNIFNYRELRQAEQYSDVFFEIYLAFVKMRSRHYSMEDMREVCRLSVKNMFEDSEKYGKSIDFDALQNERELLLEMVEFFAQQKRNRKSNQTEKEYARMKEVMIAIYDNLHNINLSIQYLAKEILYMNEDYFGRFFYKQQNVKFSTFLLEVRIRLAMRMLGFDPDIRIADLAEMVGYAPDGQYFSKVFRKVSGMTPTEYRDLQRKKQKHMEMNG